MSHAVLKIPVRMPLEAGRSEGCLDCIRQRLAGRRGLSRMSVAGAGSDSVLELEYDPRVLSMSQLERELKCVDACLSPDIAHVVLGIEGMTSFNSEKHINDALRELPGVMAQASYAGSLL